MTAAPRPTSASTAANFASPTDVTRLNAMQIAALNTTQLRGLSIDNVRALSTTQIAALKPAALAGLSSTQANALSAAQLAAFTPTQVAAFTSTVTATLDATDVGALRAAQLGALSANGMKGLNASSLAAMTRTQLAGISTTAIAVLSLTQIRALDPTEISAFTATQVRSLTANNVNGLSASQQQSLNIPAFTARQMSALDKSAASHLSTTQLQALAATQIAAMTASASSALSSTQVAALSPQQLKAMKSTRIGEADGLQINLLWALSTARAPTGFREAVIAAARSFTDDFSNRATINIQVGFGETNGKRISSGAVAQTMALGSLTNYATIRNALLAEPNTSEFETTAEATLASSDPTGGGRFLANSAYKKALGLSDPFSGAVDGYIGLSSTLPMDFTHSGAAGKFDAIGAMQHEISEVLGRTASVGAGFGVNVFTTLDLFRFKPDANGGASSRALRPGGAHDYFSIDGGATNLGNFNATPGAADYGDWNATEAGDAYGFGMPGVASTTPARDIIVMAALGYNLTAKGLADARGQTSNALV